MANARAIFELVRPRRSWSQFAQQKQRELYVSQQLLAMQQQRAATVKKSAEDFARQINQLKQLPFEAPDKASISEFLMNERENLSKTISENYDNLESFLNNGASIWAQELQSKLLNSDVYKKAVNNTANIAMAKKAIQKGEQLIGTTINGTYKTGEEVLAEYYRNGGSFSFSGSYKTAEVGKSLYEHFSKLENPNGKFSEQRDVPIDEVYGYLSRVNPDIAKDFAQRSSLTGFSYKRFTPEEKSIFDLDKQSKELGIQRKQQLINNDNAKREEERSRPSYFDVVKNNGFASNVNGIVSENSKAFQVFDGISLSDLSDENGNISFFEHEAKAVTPRLLEGAGIKKATQDSNGYFIKDSYNSKIDKAFSFINGETVPVDFKNRTFVVSSNDGKLYLPEKQRINKNGVFSYSTNDAFVKLQISLDDPETLQDGDTKDKIEDDLEYFQGIFGDNMELRNGFYIFDVMMPVENVFNNQILNKNATKGLYGLKDSNESNIIPSTSSL